MTDYYENCRWFLRSGGPDAPYVEVTRQDWLVAEHYAGFRGGGMKQPSTGAWSVGNSQSGVIVYPHEAIPAGAVELGAPKPTVTYNWGHQVRASLSSPWGAVWESHEDEHANAEDRARQKVEEAIRLRGLGTARLVRARVETYPWEEVDV